MDDKYAIYQRAYWALCYISCVKFRFFSPEKRSVLQAPSEIIQTAVNHPDELLVKVTVLRPLQTTHLRFNDFLQKKRLCEQGQSTFFTYITVFEEICGDVLRDINYHRLLLLHTMNNSHFILEFTDANKCPIYTVDSIIQVALNYGCHRLVRLIRICKCCDNNSVCQMTPDDIYTYNDIFNDILPKSSISKTNYNLKNQITFPKLVNSRKVLCSFS